MKHRVFALLNLAMIVVFVCAGCGSGTSPGETARVTKTYPTPFVRGERYEPLQYDLVFLEKGGATYVCAVEKEGKADYDDAFFIVEGASSTDIVVLGSGIQNRDAVRLKVTKDRGITVKKSGDRATVKGIDKEILFEYAVDD